MSKAELQEVKKQVKLIMRSTTNDFIMLTHEHVEGDVWKVMCRSELTGNYYTFKSEGSELYDFKERP